MFISALARCCQAISSWDSSGDNVVNVEGFRRENMETLGFRAVVCNVVYPEELSLALWCICGGVEELENL